MARQLNVAQQSAVDETAHCLVVACPGSGKTTVLVEKAASILSKTPEAKIVIATFTRDAANELRQRVVARVGEQEIARTTISTFHGLAFRQLRQSKQMTTNANILTESEQFAFASRAAAVAGLDISREDARRVIDEARITLDKPSADGDTAKLVTAYEDLLTRNQSLDFQDLMRMAVIGMRDGHVDPLKCTHLFVDEFQDTDALQYQWLRVYKDAGVVVTVVADDDQSIFGWRHAMGYAGLARFHRDFAAREIVLDTNYRCRAEILTPAAKLIECNASRIDKDMKSARGAGGTVLKYVFDDREAESDQVTQAVKASPGDWAILSRTNRKLDHIESILTLFSVPYRRSSGKDLWDKHGARIVMALCRAAQQPQKDVGIDHVLRWSGLSESTLKVFHRHLGGSLAQPGKSAALFTKTFWREEGVTDTENHRYREFVRFIKGWSTNLSAGRTDLALVGMSAWLEQECGKNREFTEAALAVSILKRLGGTLGNRVRFISQLRERKKAAAAGKDAPPAVTLSTLHGAKGLEWPNVWIISMEDGVIPDASAPLSEERRLAYVGFTRAQNRLVVSATCDRPESPFLLEAGLLSETVECRRD